MAFVYTHTKKGTDEIFYVGIGKQRRRITSVWQRNKHWTAVVDKYGFDANVMIDNIGWKNACQIEIAMIKSIGIDNLTNQTLGGDGSLGITPWNKGKKVSDKHRKINSEAQKRAWVNGSFNTDKYRAGRRSQAKKMSGEGAPNVIFTNNQVLKIREDYINGNCSYSTLAKEYNCSKPAIASIIKRRTWKHV